MKVLNGILIKNYNKFIASKFANRNNSICRRIRAMAFHNICYECKASFGKLNPDRLFYVIRCPQENMGLFALINYVVYHISIAEKYGAEPVVDWKYYPNKYITSDTTIGKVNEWECYFKNCTDVLLDDVYKSKNVIMSSGKSDTSSKKEITDDLLLKKSRELYKKYIILNDACKEKVDKEVKRLNIDKVRYLGVKCRGTDFSNASPKYHAICPTVKQVVDVIDEKEKKWGKFEKIYVATEDSNILEQMIEIYGERVCFTKSNRFSNTGDRWLGDIYELNQDRDKREDMEDYLITTYILSKCDSLIAPVVGGTLGALRISEGYNNKYIFELGQHM